MKSLVLFLPHVNASLNALATVLLIAGYWLIKHRREAAHKATMLACFGVSVVFLACYAVYHVGRHLLLGGSSQPFPTDAPAAIRYTYFFILVTHVVLAAAVPVLALRTIYLGLRDRRAQHVRIARWTYPIWLYVSVTGVIVYLLLYQLAPRL